MQTSNDLTMNIIKHLVDDQGIVEFALNVNEDKIEDRKLAELIREAKDKMREIREYVKEQAGVM